MGKAPSGIYLTSSAAYDFNTLTTTSATDPNNQTTTYSYDAAQRPTGFTSPTGANGVTSYNAWGEQTSSSVTWNEGGTNKTVTQTAVYDGWGQMTSAVEGSGAQTNHTYDNMGRMLTRTNPFAQGGTPGPVTTYGYDLLGRNTLVTLPGGNTMQTAYTNSTIVTVTDQVNRKIKRESDGLGRLIKVTEQDVSTGNLTQETNYTYDIADRLTLVNQGNQTRAFKYDAEGKLLFERIPEQSATINDGTRTYWTSKYTYTDWGAVATKQDARGVITTYVYDTLHRLVSISYNTVSGVTTAPTVTYNYDNNQSSTTKGLLLSLSVGTGYSESYVYDSFKRVQSVTRTMDGRSYTTSYQLNTANQLTQMVYPVSGRTLNIGHDSVGRVSSMADQYRTYINNFTYNGAGQVTGFSLGTVASESYGYDANRMQLTSQTATQTGGPANGLMNLTYGYQASAGQMGAGSTAGNAGQLVSISGTIGGVTESAAYQYDNLGRLLTSNQTSNGSSAQRRFAYDRWGNRTAMWDATSGGNQIQSITLQQSGGVPTNRIASVTAGSTVNYAYDAAGNVANDGVHSYGYDSENRMVSVDNGSTASYAYDNQNRRYKKTVGSTVTHYVWEGSQVAGEYDGSTGGVQYNYVYSGSRLLSKIGFGVVNWFVSDRLSTRLMLDGSGNVIGRQGHLPFGEDFGESGTQEKHHFTSYERDGEAGADYALNRQYSQSVARFIRVDPSASSARMDAPQSWNRYSYAKNEPVDQVDALGLDDSPYWCPPWIGDCRPYLGAPGFSFSAKLKNVDPLGIGCNAFTSSPCFSGPFVPPPKGKSQCVVTVTARALNGVGLLGYNHMFITLWDTGTNVTDYFGAFGVGGGTGHDGGELVPRYGLFDQATAGDDFSATAVEQWTLVLPDSCTSLYKFWVGETDRISSKHLTYHPIGGPNSNSFVYTLLKRGGLSILIDRINKWVKANTVPPFGLGPVPGWGLDIS